MNVAEELLVLGGILAAALAAELLGRRTPLPRVTLLLLLGLAVGPSGAGLIPPAASAWYPLVADLALVSSRIPELGPTVLTATIASTVFFELVGPWCTRAVLRRAGETRAAPAKW